MINDRYALYQGDCVDVVKGIPDNGIHYTIFSPPFASLYTYSSSDRDMGNSKDGEEFQKHFEFLINELYRITMPGRLVSVHCMNLPAMKSRDGFIGVKDFRGDIIRQFINAGFIFHSEVCIWKNPVTEMQRTKALGLLHKQIRKDSAMCRQGLPDYLVTFRKPGENPEPIPHTHETFPVNVWQRYASPVWMDIRQSNTLQRKSARDEKDEKHICPLQLDVIERGIDLWTNPGDIVLDPFAGIGSVPYQALLMDRRAIGIELKDTYFNQMKSNMEQVEEETTQLTLDLDTNVLLRCPICGVKVPGGESNCKNCGYEIRT
jgi:DNA modification methylase